MTDRMEKIIAAGEADHEAVRLQERAAVVAWLLQDAAKLKSDIAAGYWDGDEYWGERIVETIIDYANTIERGDHMKGAA
jgi:hypothetical protein